MMRTNAVDGDAAGTAIRRAIRRPPAAVRTMMKIAAARVCVVVMRTTIAAAAVAGAGLAIRKATPMPLVAAGTRTTTGAAPVRGTAMTTTTIAAARVRAVAMTMRTIAADRGAAGGGPGTRGATL